MDVLQYPLATEKAIRSIESDNIITFIVDKRSSKNLIKKAFEEKFKVKVDDVSTVITSKSVKKAYIKLKKEFNALDIATQLGLM
jgi:large subunit ribosomal protein L23